MADPLVSKLFIAVAGLLVISLLIRSFQYSLTRYLKDSDSRYYGRKLITFSGYLAGFVFITIVFKDRLGGLTVAIGVASAGITFSLQEVIASVAGWIAISAGGFYNPGDRVQIGGSKGDVIDIGILRTTLMELGEWVESDLYTGRIVRIANSFVFKAPVFNYSGDFPYLWDEIKIPVKYGSDHRLARSILEQVIAEMIPTNTTANVKAAWQVMFRKYLIEDARIDPVVSLVLTDNWIEFTIRYVVDYKTRRLIKDQLFTRILDEFARTEQRVNIASTTIQLTEAPTLNVKLDNNRPENNRL
ncbi:MAG: mechanosensitive ion channel family protein [Synechococcaceae cyanobacterium MAG-AL2]|uniref:mechanosensitive ion channel family protein n=1 Tax=Candidatus Regnicoccus frigidus TaxID=3074015 RepID=UPI00281E13E4|nr:mechanosensitive ion channel domain-containing protein [Candidatus Regnicoccus frigidus]MCT4366361.1 mechanosensitive ion channel family protein [Candidatus Regnicoccus frigidus MAG-AL2]